MADEVNDDRPASDPSETAADPEQPERAPAGPDPVIGAGIALLGIFLMGTGGASDAHYVFNAGVLTAIIGAILFVLFVALSALKLRRAEKQGEPPDRPELVSPAHDADLIL
jgi:hypothetical protein